MLFHHSSIIFLRSPALLLVAFAAASVHASPLRVSLYSNSVFGSPARISASPAVSLPSFNASTVASVLLEGTLTPPHVGETLSFSGLTSGVLRVYVDDHLVLDDSARGCSRSASTWQGWPVSLDATRVGVPLRVEWTHDPSCASPVLELLWSGNATALSPVPATALSAPPALGPRAELAALRTRLYEPAVPWQTYWAPSMTTHALQPTGLLLQFSVGDTATGAYLGDVRVFPDFSPAWVRTGGHSWGGSDYTAVHVSRWLSAGAAAPALNATVSFFSSAATAAGTPCDGPEGAGGTRCDLVLVAACEGSDCARLVLMMSVAWGWGGGGDVASNASAVIATPDGFPSTVAVACTPIMLGGGEQMAPAGLPQPRVAVPPTPSSGGVPAHALLLPFSTPADLPWSGPGSGSGVLVAMVSTGAARSVAAGVALVSAARARYDASAAAFGDVADLYEPMRAVLAWNTLYAHYVGVYTPVSRNWYHGDDIGTFVWDVYFAAVMISTDRDARARDIAMNNVVTTTLSRTMSGMIPNYSSGRSGTYDRTEPAVGAWAVRVLRDRFGANAAWLPELLLPALVAWHDWFHAHRRNVGVLAEGGADGLADVISLGSDATDPPGLNTPHTLAAARYESGLDNSPQYDGDDGLCSGPSCPCRFNDSNALMNLYDVAFTAYHIVDADSILALAGPLNRSDLVPRMRDRAQRAAAALNARMWSNELGSYANLLTNGTFVPRWAPTVFSPLFAGIVPRGSGRIESMMRLIGDPEKFCINTSHTGSGGPASRPLLNFGTAGAPTAVSCVTDACLVDAVLRNTGATPALQAIVAGAPSGVLLPLNLYAAPLLGGASALATPAHAPAYAAFELVRTEGYCARTPSAAAPVPLTLWASPSAPPADVCSPQTGVDYVGSDLVNKTLPSVAACCSFCQATPGCAAWKTLEGGGICYLKTALAHPTPCARCVVGSSLPPAPAFTTCATPACNASAAAAGLVPSAPMCYASPAATPLDWPCIVALPAISRSDPAFADQTYWRGRAWAPQAFLTWLALQRYADVEPAADARRTLVAMATATFRRQIALFGQVNENLDGLFGLGSDSNRADSYYHWGALNAFLGIVEAGHYPANVLVAPA